MKVPAVDCPRDIRNTLSVSVYSNAGETHCTCSYEHNRQLHAARKFMKSQSKIDIENYERITVKRIL